MKSTFLTFGLRSTYIVGFGFASFLSIGTNALGATSVPTDAEVLKALATKGMDHHLKEVAEKAEILQKNAQILCENKNKKSLEKAQNSWKAAYFSWRAASPYLVGPADELKLDYKLGGWKSNDTIMEAVTSSNEYDYLRDNIEMRGYAAAEYILFVPQDATAVTTTERCSHLIDVTEEIADLTKKAKEKWDNNFKEGFITAGNGLPYMVPGDALSLVVAEILNTTEVLLRDRIGLPSNFFNGEAHPELLEAWHSKSSLNAIKAAFNGLKTSLNGDANASITQLIATRDGLTHKKNPALAKNIEKHLEKIQKILNNLSNEGPNLHSAIANDPATLKKLYKQLQKLQENLEQTVLALELDIRAGLEAQLTQ